MNSWDSDYVQLNLDIELDEFKSCKSDWQNFANDFYASLYNSVSSIDRNASEFKKALSVIIKNYNQNQNASEQLSLPLEQAE
ncbi:hypothetical protein GCM10007417_25760 [Glycocaulis alkaliphilus]|nr:hypothetical protein GCM10007417_25760 [Glycocaulis alkaliphilus]